MGIHRAHIKFLNFVFLAPPNRAPYGANNSCPDRKLTFQLSGNILQNRMLQEHPDMTFIK